MLCLVIELSFLEAQDLAGPGLLLFTAQNVKAPVWRPGLLLFKTSAMAAENLDKKMVAFFL